MPCRVEPAHAWREPAWPECSVGRGPETSWTGQRWIISLNKKIGEKTIFEKKNETKNQQINEAKNNEKIKMLLEAFDDAVLVNVNKEDD